MPIGSIVSSVLGFIGAGEAADAATSASQIPLSMYNQSRTALQPYINSGQWSLAELQRRMQAGPGDVTTSPGYTNRLNTGVAALDASAAARGSLGSGAHLRSLNRYAQDYASNEYNNFYNQYLQGLAPYQGLAALGSQTGLGLGSLGQNAAQTASGQVAKSGEYRQSGYNALGGGLADALSYFNFSSYNPRTPGSGSMGGQWPG